MAKSNPLAKFQSILKRVRREHPAMSFRAAQQLAAKQNAAGAGVSGAKKKTRKAPAAKRTKVTVKVAGAKKRKTGVKHSAARMATRISKSITQQGREILANIATLEREYKSKKLRHEKQFLAKVINAEHAKLEKLQRRLKSA